MTLPTFIDEYGHDVLTLFALVPPASTRPAFVVAFVVVTQVLCQRSNPLVSSPLPGLLPPLLNAWLVSIWRIHFVHLSQRNIYSKIEKNHVSIVLAFIVLVFVVLVFIVLVFIVPAFISLVASIDLSSTFQKVVFVPVFASASLPGGTADVTKLEPTPAAISNS